MKLYEQVADQIIHLVEQGALKPGERIPSIRQASQNQKVSVSTVLQAYSLLESRGIIEGRPQSGYYIRGRGLDLPEEPEKTTPGVVSTEVDVSSLVFEVLNAIKQPNIVPLGSPFPSPELFPLAKLNQYMCAIGRRYDPWSTISDMPPGNEELRRQLARRYLENGYAVSPDEIVITIGAMEALNLCLQAVTKPGDAIAIESPAFYAQLHAIERLGLKALEMPTHPREGIDLAALEAALRDGQVNACLLMPNFANPLGGLMPEAKKKALVELLARHEVPLIEDDVYHELYLGSSHPKAAKAYDQHGLVMHCSSFSKSLAPGYRIGWAIPGRFKTRVEQLKLMNTLATPPLPQMALAEYLKHGGYDKHLRSLRQHFATQLHRMMQAITEHFPKGTRFTRPEGGYVLWVELPEKVDSLRLYQLALQHDISIAPGPIFSATRSYRNFIRLNYGYPWTPEIEQAIRTLGKLAQALM